MPKSHVLSQTPSSMNISSHTQQILCYVGQQAVFEEAQALLSKLLGLEINAKQIERVCHYIGDEIEKGDKSIIETQIHRKYGLEEKNQLHYAMLDGAMYLTREDKWKEAKMGRIFKDSDNINISKNRELITGSQYVVHLGGHKEFLNISEYSGSSSILGNKLHDYDYC